MKGLWSLQARQRYTSYNNQFIAAIGCRIHYLKTFGYKLAMWYITVHFIFRVSRILGLRRTNNHQIIDHHIVDELKAVFHHLRGHGKFDEMTNGLLFDMHLMEFYSISCFFYNYYGFYKIRLNV